jgi:hypothetical protein
MYRTPEEEAARQLKIISYQLSPLSAFLRASLIFFFASVAIGFVALVAFTFRRLL